MKKQLLLIAFGMLWVSIADADRNGRHSRGSYYPQPQVNRYYGRSPPQAYPYYRSQRSPVYNQPVRRHYGGMSARHGPVKGAIGGIPGRRFHGNYPSSRGFGAAPWSLGFGFGPASGAVFGGFGPRPGR